MEMSPLRYANDLRICLEMGLPFFQIQVNCFMARDDSPWAMLFQNAVVWVRGLVPLFQF